MGHDAVDVESSLTGLEAALAKVRDTHRLMQEQREALEQKEAEATALLASVEARDAGLREREQRVAEGEAALQQEKDRMQDYLGPNASKPAEVLELNVGGTEVTTFLSTLTKYENTFFSALFSGRYPVTHDSKGRIVIDRPAKPFLTILDWLRTGAWLPETDANQYSMLLNELDFYGLAPYLKQQIVPAAGTSVHSSPHSGLEQTPGEVPPLYEALDESSLSCEPVELYHTPRGDADEEERVFHVTPPHVVPNLQTAAPHEQQYPLSREWRWEHDTARLFVSQGDRKAVPKVGERLLTPVYVSDTLLGEKRSVIKIKTAGIKAGLEIQYGLFKGTDLPKTLLNKRNPCALGWRGTHEGTVLYPTSLIGCIDYMVVMEVTQASGVSTLRIYNSKELKGCTEKSADWLRVPDSEITFQASDDWRFIVLSPAGVSLSIVA
eukprot:TRINITY_DN13687_c0_g2_i1.p1 TRINITY_DN13687_c0_g2~~TRINITY_DN13687_c0_g2_i1.p1  ORF type:complete len:437 (+),score=168.70 TRINITY_DN13687_c0_g2_i1:138-1448(+)